MSDKTKPRGLVLKMQGKDETWTMVILGTEINVCKKSAGVWIIFEMRLPVNGKVDQEKIKRLMSKVYSYRQFAEYTAKMSVTPSVANTACCSVHTLLFQE